MVAAVSAVVAVVVVHVGLAPGPWSALVAVLGAALGLGIALLTARSGARQLLRASPGALGPRMVRAEADGLVLATPEATARFAWTGVRGVVEFDDAIAVLAGPLAAIVVPRAAFDDPGHATAFRDRIEAAVAAAGPSDDADAPWRLPPVPFGPREAVVAAVAVLVVEYPVLDGAYRWSEPVGDLWWAAGGLVTTLVAVRLLASARLPRALALVFGGRPTWRHAAIGIALGIAIGFVDEALAIVVGGVWPAALGTSQAWLDEATLVTPVATTVAVVVTGPLAEELLFRGVLLRGLHRRFGLLVAVVGSSLAFAAVHPSDLSAPAVLLLASTFLAGVLFALATAWTGTLTVAVVAHVVANLAVTLWALLGGGAGWVVPVGPDEPVTAFELAVGACADGFPDEVGAGEQRSWTAADGLGCTHPHDIEVYLREPLDLPQAATPDTIEAEADQRCYDAFDDYVGRDWQTSVFDYLALVPGRGTPTRSTATSSACCTTSTGTCSRGPRVAAAADRPGRSAPDA